MNKEDQNSIESLSKEFQHLHAQMQLPQHRNAVEALFQATAEDLNRAYRDSDLNSSGDLDSPNTFSSK
ncbi:hypothetical protein [Ketobacter sp.]